MLKDEKATAYLLVWPIFEQELFNGFMHKADIQTVAAAYQNYYQKLSIEKMVEHFHNRYQDKTCYKHLKHDDASPLIDAILKKEFDTLTDTEKLELAIYTVYRYRNNIFHGNKGIKSWSNYTKQIEYCISIMISLLDCAKAYKGGIA